MILKLYAIVDTVAEEYGPLFQAKNDGVAIRNFQALLHEKKADPSEMQLWYIADYNTENGILSDGATPQNDIDPGSGYIACRYNILAKVTTETDPDE